MNQPLQRVLYVEDEPDIQAVAKLALETVGGLEVRVSSNGDEALQVAPTFAADLLLLDVMMPGMDGPTTLARLREMPAFSKTPAVFMTAKVQPSEVAHLKSLGALEVIAKPFDPMTLADTLKKLFASAQQ
ncbi:response regulator [Atopomonas sediminilitoris]|uniref:response regulator n=1 Tax=Atopomonas sediminilitoris TaxID=2919919 RepID=UPI001F4E51B4|nr:response regulator [Atopomonas sediminilitoris]MCJ8169014.1 response regulator [Atopomonas sediminilitoris]